MVLSEDMLAYIFGVFVWNYLIPEPARMSETMMTASSVVTQSKVGVLAWGTLFSNL